MKTRSRVLRKPLPIPCTGRWTHTTDGSEFDCTYAHVDGFGCEDCVVNGGRMDPRTGKQFAGEEDGLKRSKPRLPSWRFRYSKKDKLWKAKAAYFEFTIWEEHNGGFDGCLEVLATPKAKRWHNWTCMIDFRSVPTREGLIAAAEAAALAAGVVLPRRERRPKLLDYERVISAAARKGTPYC